MVVGITALRMAILAYVGTKNNVHIGKIVSSGLSSPSALTAAVRDLQKGGLVYVQQEHVGLSKKGEDVYNAINNVLRPPRDGLIIESLSHILRGTL